MCLSQPAVVAFIIGQIHIRTQKTRQPATHSHTLSHQNRHKIHGAHQPIKHTPCTHTLTHTNTDTHTQKHRTQLTQMLMRLRKITRKLCKLLHKSHSGRANTGISTSMQLCSVCSQDYTSFAACGCVAWGAPTRRSGHR